MPPDTASLTADYTSDSSPSGRVRLLTMADLDKRTRAARQADELFAELVDDLGGEDRISAAQRELARQAAIASAMITDSSARWLRGEPVAFAEHFTALNAYRRVLLALGLERRARPVAPMRERLMAG